MQPQLIALLSRRLGLLADWPEQLYASRPEPTTAGKKLGDLSLLDSSLLTTASALDRTCAHAVRTFTNTPITLTSLALLSELPSDYLVAIYLALPPERRRWVRRDMVWAHHLEEAPMEEIERDVEALKSDVFQSFCEQIGVDDPGLLRWHRLLSRRWLGLPCQMTPEEAAMAESADELAQGAVQVARDGGDVEGYIRDWVEAEMGRPLYDAS